MDHTQSLGTADLTVKCLKCKNTYEVEDVSVQMDAVFSDDSHGVNFLHYAVTLNFAGTNGAPVYLQDLLCLPRSCSVVGRSPDGTKFAFACLTLPRRHDEIWVSAPGPDGYHFAIKGPTA